MELHDYLRVIRKRWPVIALVTVLTLAASAVLTFVSPKIYESRTEFFVSTSGAQDTGQLLQGSSFTQQRVKSYSQLLTTPKVLTPVIEQLGLGVTPEDLARSVTTTVPLDTVLIDVAVSNRDPALATRIAGAIGQQFPAAVGELERVSSSQPSPVKVTVVQAPSTPTAPISPKPARNLALGLVLGLLLGLGLALLRDMLDTRVKDERDVAEVTDRTVLGSISYDADAPSHPLIVQADPKSQRAEAFRSLRTNLQFVGAADQSRSIVVTSSVPGEGKTTTAANLGLTLAAAGSRVCIVEGDLRRPRLLDYLGLEGAVGVTDVLIGRVGLVDVLQEFGDTSMWVLGAGAIPPNPSELLGSPVMARTIKELEARFEYVLIDAPPLLPVTDAAIISTVVGGAVVVVGAGVVTKEHLDRALGALDSVKANTLGLVLNRLPAQHRGGYGSYRYEYTSESPAGKGRGRAAKPAATPEAREREPV